ncbi:MULTISPECIES: PAS domain-containing sensor histidine kinase [Pseudomonas]|uniref:histidine kinase n=1 Tax=Pseudomonas putida TaxID=303 RepID=A0A1L7NCY2_PSEPU|nr:MULTISPECIES: PAS domain-containing sensor histidine kinase [Pseudomonas]AGN79068.1 sensor histidine kinase [Pseudomonas putida H8234]EKT4559788.1 PAS domain-containing protein [Pseudomonas putida]MBP2083362.1 PAS domain S-box-containing protein [Pseudomonas sp. PvP089]MBP2090935.1 PAS domain S-box-containing protein [Pseudomonas sp. PvP088]MBP2222901.1 PAS domain S-box-containing protein [Pseudomonas putida]
MDREAAGSSGDLDAPALTNQESAFPTTALERLQLALDAGAIIGTWVWDIRPNQVTADERFSRSFGLPADKCMAGIPIEEAFASIHPDDRDRVSADIQEAMGRGGGFRCEYRVRQHDGSYRWIEANGRAELDEEGQAVRFPGILMDVESRRSAEAERDRMSALLRTFTAAVPGVVYAKDREGRLIVANDGVTQLVGKPPELYLGKTDLEFLEDKAQARQIMETDRLVMHGGKAVQIEERVDMPDGTATYWLSVKAPLCDEAGEVMGLIGSSIDVTARKNAESELLELNRTLEAKIEQAVAEREAAHAALRQSQKMEAVGQLTGGIAHDFNNLLAGITGSLDLIKLRLKQGRIADVERYLTVAHGAAQRAASLTHRLLAFSRRQTLMPVHTDVNTLISDMEELIRRTVGPAIQLKVELQAKSSTCLVDPAQVENALLNLCINARDALEGGGSISIKTYNEELVQGDALDPELAPGTYFTVCVADDGVGMSTETLARAFEPFFTTKPVGAGTGLGLSMIYGFAKQSGGQVRIESQVGRGARVYLQLPSLKVEADAAGRTEPLPESELTSSGETVLVVDDEPSVRMFVSESLGSCGYIVIEATDSLAGLQLLRSDTRIDLLVTDIGLPGGTDGRQMANTGRSIRPGLPVLFMTGYAQPKILDNAQLEPNTAVLTKPFTLETLTLTVNALLKNCC